jgi:hypothetical protein
METADKPPNVHTTYQSRENSLLNEDRSSVKERGLSLVTQETRFTNFQSHSLDLEEYSPTKPSPEEVEAASQRSNQLHGKHFGRSLTLEENI